MHFMLYHIIANCISKTSYLEVAVAKTTALNCEDFNTTFFDIILKHLKKNEIHASFFSNV